MGRIPRIKKIITTLFMIVTLTLATSLALFGCSSTQDYESASPDKGSVLHGSGFDLVISIEAAGPVEWVYSPPPSKEGKIYTPFLFPDGQPCLLRLRMTPLRFVEGQEIYAGILVRTRDIDYVVAGISVGWSAAELTEPVKPADDERDVRVLEAYENSMASYPPSKVFFLQFPMEAMYDKSVAALLGEIYTKAIQDSTYHAGVMDQQIYSSDPIAIDGLDQIFNKYLYFSLD
jgi:hypothetical protein